MKEKVLEITKELENIDEVKRIKILKENIKNNEEYNKLMKNFKKNKQTYIENNTLNDELIKLRKELFKIEDLKEYLKLQNDIRLLSVKINSIIKSVIE